ncbi:MAG: amino acid permease [Proteobacteria bacterium]|nr:amino acid permease [Pseudomonadota bacterium]
MTSVPSTKLRRSISLPLVFLYGLGNILGAGIYVLIGRVAAEAGYLAPLAFVIAALIAAITAFSFAELSSRFPHSAGGALYVHRGFRIPNLTVVVGLLIVLSGIASAATMANGFVGYLQVFFDAPARLVIISLVLSLCVLACWGIAESVSMAVVLTLIEVFGLLLVMGVTLPELKELIPTTTQQLPSTGFLGWTGLVSGSFLAFYAYIGFEDMVNVVEEVKNPTRNLPIAILAALTLATVLYVLVAINVLLVLTPADLGESEAPLADVYETVTGSSPWAISVISMFAVINGALIQIIMGSRVLYGLSREKLISKAIGRVNEKTRTPVNATILVSVVITIAALWFPIETLARSTTTLLLVIFTLVNIALIKIKTRDGHPPGVFRVPFVLPVFGTLVSVSFLIMESVSLFLG